MQGILRQLVLNVLRENGLPQIDPEFRDIPFQGKIGFALTSVFQIAREAYPEAKKEEIKAKVDQIASMICKALAKSGLFETVHVDQGYVNCIVEPGLFSRKLIQNILINGSDWARGTEGRGRVMIEYSQPNTHKAFHIGHVRNVVLGSTLVRCFKYAGYDTIAANYIGDSGAHIFKSLWYLQKYAEKIKPLPVKREERGIWLGEIYAQAEILVAESEDLKNKVWDILKKLSESLIAVWKDDDLIHNLGIDPRLRRIALKEEDLFGKRSPEDVANILMNLAKVNLALYREGRRIGTVECAGTAQSLASELEMLLNQENFQETWNREREILEVASRWAVKDPELIHLWQETRQWSLEDFQRIYVELNAPFDEKAVYFESEVEEEGLKIVSELANEGLVTESEGAKIIEIDKKLHELLGEPMRNKYRVLVLVRSDGSALYSTKELALAKKKFNEFGIEESIYVVGVDQKFYFEQIFQVLRLMGFPQWKKCYHLSYELVMLPSGKMSSRKGQVVLYDDVMNELKARALEVVKQKNQALPDDKKIEVANDVALGALIYGMLKVDTNKRINFDFDEVLDFDGRSAPYIQYAGARASSILKKAQAEGISFNDGVKDSDFSYDLHPVEIELIKIINRLPMVIEKVIKDKKPIHLASYAYDLAGAFAEFYHQCPVLSAEFQICHSRLLLVDAFKKTLETSLQLMGIPSPSVM